MQYNLSNVTILFNKMVEHNNTKVRQILACMRSLRWALHGCMYVKEILIKKKQRN